MPRFRDLILPKGEFTWSILSLSTVPLLTRENRFISFLFLHGPAYHPVLLMLFSVIEYMSFSDADSAIKTLDGVEMRGSVVRVKEGQPAPGQSWENPVGSALHTI